MELNYYEVVVWKKDTKGKFSCNTKWHGTDLVQGEVIAAHIYGRELLKEELKRRLNENEYTFNLLEENLKEEYFCELKDRRITLREIVTGRNEARGQLPKLIKSYGDETIELFQRSSLS